MDRVTDEWIEDRIQFWQLNGPVRGNNEYIMLQEIQQWRAQRCETCAVRRTCVVLFEAWDYLCETGLKDRFGCRLWRARQAKEGKRDE